MGNWSAALARAEVMCKFCGEWRLLERIGREWFCAVCGRSFKA
jgi:ribosomal protein L37AE/L43A